MLLTIITFILMAVAAILAMGLLLWLIGHVLPARRTFTASRPVYLPPYMTLNQVNANPFPGHFRGDKQGATFVQRLDRRGRALVTWTKVDDGDQVEWHSESAKSPCGSFRYRVREKGIMSELDYERVLVIRRPMMRLFGLLISLRRETRDLLERFEPDAQKG